MNLPERRYALGRVCLTVQWPDEDAASLGEKLMDYHGFAPWEDAGAPATDPPVAWRMELDGAHRLIVPEGARRIGAHPSGLEVMRTGAGLMLVGGDRFTCIDPARWRVRGNIGGGLAGVAVREAFVLHTTLTLVALLQYSGHFALHAAALCRGTEDGVLLVAPSGSGKSTLATGLVRSGWGFVTDDSVLLHRTSNGVEAASLRRHFYLRPDARAIFPETAGIATSAWEEAGKWGLQPERVYDAPRVPACRPGLLVFPEIADVPSSTLSPVGAQEAFAGVVSQSSFMDPALTMAHTAVLQSLLNQCASYRLVAGRDLKNDPSRFSEMLAGLAEPTHS